MDGLDSDLDRLVSAAAVPHGGGAAIAGLSEDVSLLAATPDRSRSCVPGDFRRAAPEIYRSIRAQGSISVRDWMAANFWGSRQSSEWIDLWSAAASIDFRVASCSN